jgi:predicted nucleotidyltransferase
MRRQADVTTVLSGAATREPTVVPDFLSARERLLAEAARFVRNARGLPGVCRIALLGSVLTDKAEPKDVDLLVSIDETADLGVLATLARRLQGRLQSCGRGADVFLDCEWRAMRSTAADGRTCTMISERFAWSLK